MVESVSVSGYKTFKNLCLKLDGVNLLIGSNGAGKSNFLSLFELLNHAFEQRLAGYVGSIGGVDKLLFQGRKATEQISTRLDLGQNSYQLTLQEADGRLIVADERFGYCSPGGIENTVSISHFSPESAIKTYNGMERGDYAKTYLSHIRKFHFYDTGCRSPFASECHAQNDGYYLYANGGNLSAILFRIFNEYPLIYRRIVKVIRSVTPYFGDLVRCFMVILSRLILASGK